MLNKHHLKSLAPDLSAGDCQWCGPNTPLIKNGYKYLCANDIERMPTKKSADRMAARVKAFTAKTDRLQRFYAMTYMEYLTLLDNQEYACAICTETFTKDSPPHIDHDHACCPDKTSCGACVRGLLCRRCNTAIGYFRDDTRALRGAIAYLSTNS